MQRIGYKQRRPSGPIPVARAQNAPPVGGPGAAEQFIPANFWEWLFSVYPPDRYLYRWTERTLTLDLAAGASGISDNISIADPFFCFGFLSQGWDAATGNPPISPYRLSIRDAADNQWMDGTLAAGIVTGDLAWAIDPAAGAAIANGYASRPWAWPRELDANSTITITADNNTSAAATAITVDVGLWGYLIRTRAEPVIRGRVKAPVAR